MNLHTEYYVTVHIIVSLVAFYHLNIFFVFYMTDVLSLAHGACDNSTTFY